MSSLSLSAAAEQTRSFLRREAGLVLPIAFATFGIALIIVALAAPEASADGRVQPGLWSLALFPMIFLGVVGQLAISYLVLRPGASVRDALGAAMLRLPTALALILLMMAAVAVVALLLGLITGFALLAGAGVNALSMVLALGLAGFGLWLGARLLLLWPLIADRREGAIASIRQSFALSRGHVWKFIVLMFAFGLVYVVVTGAVQLGLGSVLLILGRLLGAEGAAMFVAAIVTALLGAAIQAVWAVLLSNIYRQITAPVAPTKV